MTNLGPWYTEDFDSLSWHDAHLYGFRLESFDSEEGAADLIIDMDYILKWDCSGDRPLFTVCKAELIFHKVFGLKINLDYSTPAAGMCPFAIDGIEREPLVFPTGGRSFRWKIPVNWPEGSLCFEAPEFTLTLVEDPVIQTNQWLSQRSNDEKKPKQ